MFRVDLGTDTLPPELEGVFTSYVEAKKATEAYLAKSGIELLPPELRPIPVQGTGGSLVANEHLIASGLVGRGTAKLFRK